MKGVFDWRHFFILAQDVCKKYSSAENFELKDEALCRTGISRAYYAVFHESRKYLQEIEPHYLEKIRAKGSHDKVILGFEQIDDKHVRNIGKELGRFKEMRIRADYDESRYAKSGNSGSVINELRKALFYAEKISKQIRMCRESQSS